MNVRALGITASVLVNVALLFGVLHRSPIPSAADTAAALARAAFPAPRTADRTSVPSPAWWQDLSSGSLADVAARLKAEGFPPRVQRQVIAALVRQQFADRHRALADMIRSRPWWRPLWDSSEGARLIATRQKLQQEESDAVDALLGPDLGSTPYITASRAFRYGNLPPPTLARLDRINADYGELMDEIRNASRGITLPEDREKLLFLTRQGRADVAQLLTPDELFEYDLRSSPEGWWLRTLTGPMNVTEDEFRALFKVRSAFIAPFSDGQYQLMSAEDKAALAKLEPQLDEQIRGVLTPDRFAEYKLKSTPEYRQTAALVERLALPAESAASIVTLQHEITDRATAVRTNPALSPLTRNAQLGALADEAVARLTPTLGADGLTAYKQGAGAWLNQLNPPPASGAPKG